MYKAMIAAFGIALAAMLLANGCGVSTNVEVEDTPVVPKASPLSWENAMATVERKRELENPNVRDEPNPRYAPPRTPDPRLFTPVPTPRAVFSFSQAPRIESGEYGRQHIVGVLQYNADLYLRPFKISCYVIGGGVRIAYGFDTVDVLQPRSQWRFRALLSDGVGGYESIDCHADGY